jgi:hypothetical protein
MQSQEVTKPEALLKPDATTADFLQSILPRPVETKASCSGPPAVVLEDGGFKQLSSSHQNVAASMASDHLMWSAWEVSAVPAHCSKSEVYDEMDDVGSSVKWIPFGTLHIDEQRFYNCIREIATSGSFSPFFTSFTDSLMTDMGEKKRKLCKLSAGIFEGMRNVDMGGGVTLDIYDSEAVKQLIKDLQHICNYFLQNSLVSVGQSV